MIALFEVNFLMKETHKKDIKLFRQICHFSYVFHEHRKNVENALTECLI